jgi:hypothetical protein
MTNAIRRLTHCAGIVLTDDEQLRTNLGGEVIRLRGRLRGSLFSQRTPRGRYGRRFSEECKQRSPVGQ